MDQVLKTSPESTGQADADLQKQASGTQEASPASTTEQTPLEKAVAGDDVESFIALRNAEAAPKKQPDPKPAPEKTPEQQAAGEQPESATGKTEKTEAKPEAKPNEDKAREIRRELDRKAKLQRESAELDRQIAEKRKQLEAKPAETKPTEVAKRPKLADFESVEQWEDANAAWLDQQVKEQAAQRAREVVESTLTERETAQRKHAEAKSVEEAQAAARQAYADVQAAVPDWGEKVTEGFLEQLPGSLVDFSFKKGKAGLQALYQCAKDPKFTTYDPDVQGILLGQTWLAIHNGAQSKATQTVAPKKEPSPPPQHVGVTSTGPVDRVRAAADAGDVEAFIAERNAQEQAKRGLYRR